MAELNYPDPSESPWEDPNGKVWVHDGDGWVCTGESTSEDSVRVTVYDTPGAHTHTFHANAIRAEVIVTGGGGASIAGSGSTYIGRSGAAGGTAIKTFDVRQISSASVDVGAGASSGASPGGTSIYNDGTTVMQATGGDDTLDVGTNSGGIGSGGDINLVGGGGTLTLKPNADNGGQGGIGGSSYWGGGANDPAIAPYGSGGAGGTGSSGVRAGAGGVVYIKEFLVTKPNPVSGLSKAPKTTVYDTAGGPYTHNFDPAARWAKVIVTGGGAAPLTATPQRRGSAGGTAIKQFDITSANASITVGQGGQSVGADGGDSSYDDSTNTITAFGGDCDGALPPKLSTGGDINLPTSPRGDQTTSGSDVTNFGSASYWGNYGSYVRTGGGDNLVYGSGGAYGSSVEWSKGGVGVVVIEEHF